MPDPNSEPRPDPSAPTGDESGEAAAGREATGGRLTAQKSEANAERSVSTRCQSCGRDDEETEPVRRVYLTPESWDTEEKVEVLDEIEQWCFVCRTHYPHQMV